MEADVEADGSGHEDVVVCADDGSVGAVGFAFVDEVFVEASAVGLGVEVFAYDFDEGGYDHGFGGDVGVEAVFAWEALADFVFGLASGVEVGVYGGYLIEDVLGLVAAFDLAFAVVSLEGVGFYDEQGVVVPGGDLCCFPCEAVDVAVPAPLCDDCGASAFGHCEAVDDCDHRPVGFVGAASDVDDCEVSAGDVDFVVDLGFGPYPQEALSVGGEAEVFEGSGAFVGFGVYVADEAWGAASPGEGFDLILVEDHGAGMDESLDIVGGVFGGHDRVVVFGGPLLNVPVDGFESGPFLPEPPEVSARLLAG